MHSVLQSGKDQTEEGTGSVPPTVGEGLLASSVKALGTKLQAQTCKVVTLYPLSSSQISRRYTAIPALSSRRYESDKSVLGASPKQGLSYRRSAEAHAGHSLWVRDEQEDTRALTLPGFAWGKAESWIAPIFLPEPLGTAPKFWEKASLLGKADTGRLPHGPASPHPPPCPSSRPCLLNPDGSQDTAPTTPAPSPETI